jgi:hypothetical protein
MELFKPREMKYTNDGDSKQSGHILMFTINKQRGNAPNDDPVGYSAQKAGFHSGPCGWIETDLA